MTGWQDALRGVFGEDVVPDPARVEDTRTLRPGDRVRVVVEGVVTAVLADEVYVDHGRGGEPWPAPPGRPALPGADRVGRRSLDAWFLHDQPGTRVYRLPKPLPPEPPVGSHVYGQTSRQVWVHAVCEYDRDECPDRECPRVWWYAAGIRSSWADVLKREQAVRLLGDPIEAEL